MCLLRLLPIQLLVKRHERNFYEYDYTELVISGNSRI